MEANDQIVIRTGLCVGDIGAIVAMHGLIYAREQGWDHRFEAYVAGPLSEFALRTNPRERIWIVERAGVVVGVIAIVEAAPGDAQLRWFLLDPSLRGRGIGKRLIDSALTFCRDSGYAHVLLWTVAGLEPARHLYESVGFTLTLEEPGQHWDAGVVEQRFDLKL